jgi:hypothetical protein
MQGAVRAFLAVLISILVVIDVRAQSDEHDPSVPTTLESVLVVGERPGPGLWKVTNGEHTLWILGTHAPLAKDMVWRSARVEALVAQSQEVLGAGAIITDIDVNGGPIDFFKSISAYSKLTKNPDEAKLIDVLPKDTYAKWLRLKSKYIGRDSGVEKKRPIFAAMDLEKAAMKKSGFSAKKNNPLGDVIVRVAKKHGIKAEQPGYKISWHPDAKRSALIKGVSISAKQDMDCFMQTIDGLEAKLGLLKARANAWADGDIDQLTQLNQTEMAQSCAELFGMAVIAGADGDSAKEQQSTLDRMMREFERGKLYIRQHWIVDAESALKRNTITFATLPIYDLVAPDGRLAVLASKGYKIQTPSELGD